MKMLRMIALLSVLLSLTGCAKSMHAVVTDARGSVARTHVDMTRASVAIDLERDIPVYIDRASLRDWSSNGVSADNTNAEDALFAVLTELVNQTNGLRAYVPAMPDGRPEQRGRGQAEFRPLANGRYPFYLRVGASEGLRRPERGLFGWGRDRRDGGSARTYVTIELLMPDGYGGYHMVASGTNDGGFRKFLVPLLANWGLPYDPLYESSATAIVGAWEDLIDSLTVAPWADVYWSQDH